jgi:hypothetical protein
VGAQGNDWVRQQLSVGRALATAIVAATDLGTGTTFALVPSDTDRGRALQFEVGGLGRDRLDPRARLASLLIRTVGRDGLLLIEDCNASPSDPSRPGDPELEFVGGDGYQVLDPRDDQLTVDAIVQAIDWSNRWLQILVASSRLDDRGPVKLRDELAARVRMIAVSAYDTESYVVWSR